MHFGAAAAPRRAGHSFEQQYPLLCRERDQRQKIVSKSQEILTRNRKARARDCASCLHAGDDRRLDALGVEAGIDPGPRKVEVVKPGGVGCQSPLRGAGSRCDAAARWIDVRPIHLRVDAVRVIGSIRVEQDVPIEISAWARLRPNVSCLVGEPVDRLAATRALWLSRGPVFDPGARGRDRSRSRRRDTGVISVRYWDPRARIS